MAQDIIKDSTPEGLQEINRNLEAEMKSRCPKIGSKQKISDWSSLHEYMDDTMDKMFGIRYDSRKS